MLWQKIPSTPLPLEKNKADILTYANDHKLGNVDFAEEVVTSDGLLFYQSFPAAIPDQCLAR